MYQVKKGHFDFKHKVWTGVSSEAKEFVRGCLQYKPHKRYRTLHCAVPPHTHTSCAYAFTRSASFDAEQALQHSWIRRQFSEARRASGVDKVPEDVLLALRKFRTFSSIKRAALEAVVFSMNAKELAELRAVFESIDEVRIVAAVVAASVWCKAEGTHQHTHTLTRALTSRTRLAH